MLSIGSCASHHHPRFSNLRRLTILDFASERPATFTLCRDSSKISSACACVWHLSSLVPFCVLRSARSLVGTVRQVQFVESFRTTSIHSMSLLCSLFSSQQSPGSGAVTDEGALQRGGGRLLSGLWCRCDYSHGFKVLRHGSGSEALHHDWCGIQHLSRSAIVGLERHVHEKSCSSAALANGGSCRTCVHNWSEIDVLWNIRESFNRNCAPTNSGTFHKPNMRRVSTSQEQQPLGSSQDVSVNCEVSKVF